MRLLILFCLLLNFSVTSCDQPIIIEESPVVVDTSGLQVVWSKNLKDNHFTIQSRISPQGIVVSYLDNPNAKFEVFDKETGDLKHSLSPAGPNDQHPVTFTVVGDTLISNTNAGFYAIDVSTQKEIWGFNSQFSTENTYQVIDDKLYYSATDAFATYHETARLKEIDINSGEVREVLRLTKTNLEATPIIAGFNIWMHPNTGDRILMFTLSNIPNSDHANLRKSIRAYNLTKDEYLWVGKPFGTRASLASKIIIDGNVMYQPSDNSVYKFDCFTGELLWNCELDDKFETSRTNLTDLHMDEDAVYANTDHYDFFKIDKQTGQIIWERNIAANCSETILEQDGILYLSCWGEGDVLGIDKVTGEIKQRLDHGNESVEFYNRNVEYDDNLNLFYSMDLKGPVCFKLNE